MSAPIQLIETKRRRRDLAFYGFLACSIAAAAIIAAALYYFRVTP